MSSLRAAALPHIHQIALSPSSLHSADGGVELCPPFQRGREGHDRLVVLGVALSIDPALHEMDVVLVVGKAFAGFVNKFKQVNPPSLDCSSDNLTNCSPDRQWGAKKITCNGKTNRFCVGSGLTPENLKFAAPTSNPAATGVTGNDPQPPRPLPVTPTQSQRVLA